MLVVWREVTASSGYSLTVCTKDLLFAAPAKAPARSAPASSPGPCPWSKVCAAGTWLRLGTSALLDSLTSGDCEPPASGV